MLRRPLSINGLLLLAALWLAATQNATLLGRVFDSLPQPVGAGSLTFLIALGVVIFGAMLLSAALLSFPRTVRAWLALLLVIAAVCSYFMDAYGVVINDSMIANAIETDRREAGELLKWRFLAHVLLQGVVPALIVWKLPLTVGPPLRELMRRLLLVGATLLAVGLAIGLEYKTFTLWGREHRQLRWYVNPVYPIDSAIRYVRGRPQAPTLAELIPVAAGAERPATGPRPLLVVLIVGETARAANFQLDGYVRATNPELAQVPGLVSYTQVRSCGTATAESLPCMFSDLGRARFSKRAAAARLNILDVLAATGVHVVWRDNNSGCKGVCARVEVHDFNAEHADPLCASGECFDEILLRDFATLLPAPGQASLVVLHQKGSHGPAYHLRYPPEFRRFTPECERENVQECSRDEIVNAYDNTIAYTDHVIASAIAQLRAHADVDSLLLYVSDHGESLGENGLYLHGLPYAIAPDEQTRVPLMLWASDGAAATLGLDRACLQARRDAPYSHDDLFHTLLGAFEVRSTAYQREHDLLAGCRGPRGAS